jgi:glycosyltransferase involved in cell wall biosynthesis
VARQICIQGHDVHLVCQEPNPEELDFVTEVFVADNTKQILQKRFERNNLQNRTGRCSIYLPDLESVLPVYVYDVYPGFQVKELHLMSKEEIDAYAAKNIWVIEKVLKENDVDLVISNHTVLQPYEVAEARLSSPKSVHVLVLHGSALNFSVKNSETLIPYAVRGVQDAKPIAVSQHARQEFEGFFAPYIDDIGSKTAVIPVGVDTSRFQPICSEIEKKDRINEVCRTVARLVSNGRSNQQQIDFVTKVKKRQSLETIPDLIRETKETYNDWSVDADITDKLHQLDVSNNFLVMFLGKYLWTKGIQLLIAAAPLILKKHKNTHFVIVGFGQFREVLELMVHALDTGDRELFEALCFRTQQLFPGAGVKSLTYLIKFLANLEETGKLHGYYELAQDLHLSSRIIFTGYVDHDHLANLLPCADLTVATSIFPEAFGTVVAEALSSGVIPVQTHHTGFIDLITLIEEHFEDTFQGIKQLNLDELLIPSLANNISTFLDYFATMSDKERQIIRQRCARLAQDNFSWGAIVKQFFTISKEMQNSRQGRP